MPDTHLSLNMEYSNRRIKIKLNGPVQRDSPQELKQIVGRVEEERKQFVLAAIVRIMKIRKSIKHTALIQAVS